MYLDPRGQVLQAVKTYLTMQLAPFFDASHIRTAYPDAELMQKVGTATGDISPLVVLMMGDERLTRDQSNRSEAVFYLNQSNPTRPTTYLIEDARLESPFTVLVVGGGDRGQPDRAKIAQAVKSALMLVTVLPLPDGVPELATETLTYAYGLTVQLIFASTRSDDQLALQKVWSTHVVYTARYGSYHITTNALIATVRSTALLGVGGVAKPE